MNERNKRVDIRRVPMLLIEREYPSKKIICTIARESPSGPEAIGIILADVIRHSQKAHDWTEEQVNTALEYVAMEIGCPTSEVRGGPPN